MDADREHFLYCIHTLYGSGIDKGRVENDIGQLVVCHGTLESIILDVYVGYAVHYAIFIAQLKFLASQFSVIVERRFANEPAVYRLRTIHHSLRGEVYSPIHFGDLYVRLIGICVL